MTDEGQALTVSFTTGQAPPLGSPTALAAGLLNRALVAVGKTHTGRPIGAVLPRLRGLIPYDAARTSAEQDEHLIALLEDFAADLIGEARKTLDLHMSVDMAATLVPHLTQKADR